MGAARGGVLGGSAATGARGEPTNADGGGEVHWSAAVVGGEESGFATAAGAVD